MEDESPSSSTLYEISRLLTKTADGFEKMAKRGKFSDSESGTATTESDDRRKSILEVILMYSRQPFFDCRKYFGESRPFPKENEKKGD